ncbi:MAG: hypothetical protein IIC04_03435, partial [Proteobacteria bacterium]|nr:hypothetical protein [Pseudomonadota bacterium]
STRLSTGSIASQYQRLRVYWVWLVARGHVERNPFDLVPAAIAGHLIDQGISGQRTITIFQRLTLDGEQAWSGSLEECRELTQEFSDLSIMVLPRSAEGSADSGGDQHGA